MKNLMILIGAVLMAAALLLFSLAPDKLSLLILSVMTAVLGLGFVLGVVPVVLFTAGLRRALKFIREAAKVQAADASLVVLREDELFRQKDLDEAFREYKDIAQRQSQEGEVLRDISEFISEDFLSIHSWQGLMVQIPGILTGLGILGTFIGLISGIGTLAFTSVDAAIESISELITGIEAAFYTTISGVILSILFNILYRILWNNLLREHGLFIDCFHKQVAAPTDVQLRHAIRMGMQELFQKLDRFPQIAGYSPSHSGQDFYIDEGSERQLMPQVVEGLRGGQFVLYYQPIVMLKAKKKNRKLVGVEALVRWQHETLGLLTPMAFLPVLEKNAYITKLDLYLWDQVCRTLRGWLDQGARPLPVTLNVSRADILVLDLPTIFEGLLKQYKLPPRLLELDVPAGAYIEDPSVVPEALAALRALGLKVTLDNFSGDFLAFRELDRIEADAMKLDLRFLPSPENDTFLDDCFAQAKVLGVELTVSGVESPAQLAKLEALGCSTGQGFYFYQPMPLENFEELAEYRKNG